jgi:hypothetical protein
MKSKALRAGTAAVTLAVKTLTLATMAHVVDVEDRVVAPRPVPGERVRRGYLALASSFTFWLARAEAERIRFGPITLLEFGEPEVEEHGVRWPIRGGLLAARAGGWLEIRWRDGQLTGRLHGYAPWLPGPIYRLTQLPVHHAVTRLTLLQLRGRDPLPGERAGRRSITLAAAVDLALCAALARGAPRKRGLAMAGIYVGYHLAAWTLAGRTLGGALFGWRLVSVDGSPVTAPQALVRLLAGDQPAGTAAVRE